MRKGILTLVVFVLALLLFFYFESSAKGIVYSGARLLSRPLSGVSGRLASFLDYIRKDLDLEKENRALLKENKELKGKMASFNSLSRQNRELRKALGLNLSEDLDLLLARVCFRNTGEDFFIINKGEEDGAEKGLAVIDASRSFVGWVEEVYTGFSRVRLLTRKGSRVAVEFETGREKAEAEGRGGSLRLRMVPQKKDLKEGETVITSGSGKNTPQGLVVGEVAEVENLDVKPFKQANVIPSVSFSSVSTVFLIRDY